MNSGQELTQAARTGNLKRIKALIDEGASPNASFESETPLGAALNWNEIEAIKLLLENGARPDDPCASGFTPLMEAAARGYLEIVELLIAFGAQVNTREKIYGVTALMRAALTRQKEIVISLMQHGADPTIPDNTGFNVIQKAEMWGMTEIVNILSNHSRQFDSSQSCQSADSMNEASAKKSKFDPPTAENNYQIKVENEKARTEKQSHHHHDLDNTSHSEGDGNNQKYETALRLCADTAKQEFQIIKKEFAKAESEIHDLLESVSNEANKRATSGRVAGDARKKLNELSEKLKNHFRSDLRQKRGLLGKKKKHLEKFTVTLFGRTMAGKSTIREALTRGDGQTIGKGAQRTTRDVREYEWNHLRIIDTPGIGAYDGEQDREIAMSVVDETDLILFLTTTDSIQQETFESLRNLRSQNKPIIFVLNVKYNLVDSFRLNKFLKNPKKIFDERDLQGHRKRINKLAAQDLGMQDVQIVPIQAMAAFLATRKEFYQHSAILEQNSRINDLLSALQYEVTSNGRIRRLQTMLDGTILPFVDFRNKLSNEASTLDDFERLLRAKFEELIKWFQTFKADTEKRITDGVKRLFGVLKGQVGSFLDENIERADVDKRWRNKVDELRLEEKIQQMQRDILNELERKLEEFSGELQQEASFFTEMDMAGPEQCNPFNYKRLLGWTGAVASALGGLAGLAALVSASNFWNPIGWVAGAIAIVATIIAWLLPKRDDLLREKKQEASRSLMKQIEEAESKVIRESLDWFMSKVVQDIFGNVSSETTALCDGLSSISGLLKQAAERVDSYSDSLNERVIRRTAEFQNLLGAKFIDRVARYPGTLTKCLWMEGNGHEEFCEKVCEALKERIDIVSHDSLPRMVVRALCPAQVPEDNVTITNSEAIVRVPSPQIADAEGEGGINLKLAQRLLQITIRLEAEQSYD